VHGGNGVAPLSRGGRTAWAPWVERRILEREFKWQAGSVLWVWVAMGAGGAGWEG
jgi:hypothetical protein